MKKSTSLLLVSTFLTIAGSLPTSWSGQAMAMELDDNAAPKRTVTKGTKQVGPEETNKFVKEGAKQLLAFKSMAKKEDLDKMQKMQNALEKASREIYGCNFHAIPVKDKAVSLLQKQSLRHGLVLGQEMMKETFKGLIAASNKKVDPFSPLDHDFHKDMEEVIMKIKSMDLTLENKDAANNEFLLIYKTTMSKYGNAKEWQLNEELIKYETALLFKVFGSKLDDAFKTGIAKLDTELKSKK